MSRGGKIAVALISLAPALYVWWWYTGFSLYWPEFPIMVLFWLVCYAIVFVFIYVAFPSVRRRRRKRPKKGREVSGVGAQIDPMTLEVPDHLPPGLVRQGQTNFYLSEDILKVLPRPLAHAYRILIDIRDTSTNLELRGRINIVVLDLQRMDLQEARQSLRAAVWEYLTPKQQDEILSGGLGMWSDWGELKSGQYLIDPESPPKPGYIRLGDVVSPNGETQQLVLQKEGHYLLVAPPGAGKNQSYIMPNLMDYEGPVVCLDPKGENYKATAWWRMMYGDVFKFAPWDDDSDCFNPLDFVDDWDDALSLTRLLVVPDAGVGNRFWDEEARRIVAGLIWYLVVAGSPDEKNLRQLTRLLSESDYAGLAEKLLEANDEILADVAGSILSHATGDHGSSNVIKSVFSNALSNIGVWSSSKIARVTGHTTPGFNPASMLLKCREKENKAATDENVSFGTSFSRNEDGEVTFERDSMDTAYIVFPADRIQEFASVIRVLLGWTLKKVVNVAGPYVGDYDIHRRPFLFIFDELAQLGYMDVVENNAPIARGYGIRMWLVAQDIAQLKRVYPQWESIIAGCVVQTFLAPNSAGTADYVSDRMGVREDLWGKTEPALPKAELLGGKLKGKAINFLSEEKPVLVDLPVPFHVREKQDKDLAELKPILKAELEKYRAERIQELAVTKTGVRQDRDAEIDDDNGYPADIPPPVEDDEIRKPSKPQSADSAPEPDDTCSDDLKDGGERPPEFKMPKDE